MHLARYDPRHSDQSCGSAIGLPSQYVNLIVKSPKRREFCWPRLTCPVSGRQDIDPKFYLDMPCPRAKAAVLDRFARKGITSPNSAMRDGFELSLLNEYFLPDRSEADVRQPWLGICYGAQILGISAGIPLIVDIREEVGIPNRYKTNDLITILDQGLSAEESLISRIMGSQEPFLAAEAHHQALNPRPDLPAILEGRVRITATSQPDGRLAEVIEFRDRPLELGNKFNKER